MDEGPEPREAPVGRPLAESQIRHHPRAVDELASARGTTLFRVDHPYHEGLRKGADGEGPVMIIETALLTA